MLYDLLPTVIRSNCSTSSDLPANFPALFTSTMCPCTSYPEGSATSPSLDRGESRVARKVCPGWDVSELIASTSRIAIVVPEGIMTFFGAGGGGGAGGAGGRAGADCSVAMALAGAACMGALDSGALDSICWCAALGLWWTMALAGSG